MNSKEFSHKVLAWYQHHKRSLPWRGGSAYQVWLSEMMLQQTQVKTVIPFYTNFLERFPSLTALAESTLDEVYHVWQGLGYYHRARYLHETARAWIQLGRDPTGYEEWRSFPGVGPYTAAALSAILLEHPVAAIDGNIKRILQRCFGLDTLTSIRVKAQEVLPDRGYGDYTQGLMDLGAMICTPRSPKCLLCPVSSQCMFKQGIWSPLMGAKSVRPLRYAHIYLCEENQKVWTIKNTTTPLLKGLWGFPMSIPNTQESQPCVDLGVHLMYKTLRHMFTHFTLILRIWNASSKAEEIMSRWPCGIWLGSEQRKAMGFSRLMRKVESTLK